MKTKEKIKVLESNQDFADYGRLRSMGYTKEEALGIIATIKKIKPEVKK